MCLHIPSFVLTTGPHLSAAWDVAKGVFLTEHKGLPRDAGNETSHLSLGSLLCPEVSMQGPWLSLQEPDDRKLTPISNSLQQKLRPTRGMVFSGAQLTWTQRA